MDRWWRYGFDERKGSTTCVVEWMVSDWVFQSPRMRAAAGVVGRFSKIRIKVCYYHCAYTG
jgi:hypothetical protein